MVIGTGKDTLEMGKDDKSEEFFAQLKVPQETERKAPQ